MDNTTPKLGQGNITITLGNETLELKPTIHAVQEISKRWGGLLQVSELVSRLDFNVVCEVVILGLGPRYSGVKQRQAIVEKIFAAGLTDDTGGIAHQCLKYVMSLSRGGRAPVEGEELGEGDEGEQPNPPKSS